MENKITVESLIEKHKDLYKYCKPGDFASGDMALIENCCGSELAFILAVEFGGLQMTIPKNALLPMKKRYIAANFNGSNQKELAVKCDLSLSKVYAILREIQ